MLVFIIDTLIRLFLITLAAVVITFIIAVIVLSIGEKRGWW